jgi:hypothetical protein
MRPAQAARLTAMRDRQAQKKPPGLAAPAAVNSSSGNCNALEILGHEPSINMSASFAGLAKNSEQLLTQVHVRACLPSNL